MSRHSFPRLVLFDLDGTLLDSAPDFIATVNLLRSQRDMAALPLQMLRPHVSRGARAMLTAAFPALDAAGIDALVSPFLQVYEAQLARHGKPFDGIEEVLDAIETAGCRWGIVTNKPEYLARKLLALLDWQTRCAILVGGDTLPVRKPDPLPLLHAAGALGEAVHDCTYVGDDERDMAAARAAGMSSIVALWGYRLDVDDPVAWRGDVMVDTPRDLLGSSAWPQAS
ncbi:MAG: gph [Xanthomonadaceae bacterium]|nr:gph [Xanthomonadaceae bacterium]